jgi:hypothetical protein
MQVEMQENPASLVIWQTGTNAAIRHMPLDKFDSTLRGGLKLGKSLGADFIMPRTFVDLSIYLENDVLSDPPPFAPKIQYFTHDNTYRADRRPSSPA